MQADFLAWRVAAVALAAGILTVSPAAPAQAPPKAPSSKGPAAPKAAKPSTPPAVEDTATRLTNDGMKALKDSRWDEARDLLGKAYELKPSPQLALDLGRAELGAEKFRDAAEHMSLGLRDPSVNLGDAERKELEKSLEKAQANVSALRITVRPAGATVFVGGKPVGTAPLPGLVYVDPGPVVVEAKHEGYLGLRSARTAVAGQEDAVDLALPRGGGGSRGVIPPKRSTSEAFANVVKTPIFISGASATGVFVILGGTLAILSNIKSSQSHDLESPQGRLACGVTCKDQFDALQKARVNLAGGSMWSFIGAGAFLLGTSAYTVVTLVKKPAQNVKAGLVVRPDQVGAALTFQY